MKQKILACLFAALTVFCSGSIVYATGSAENCDSMTAMETVSENQITEETEAASIWHEGDDGNLHWVIDNDGVLTISGTGDYEKEFSLDGWTEVPNWLKYRDGIKSAVVNVNGITATDYMFEDCYNLKSIMWTNFDTQNVTNMSNMFHGCSSLENLDLGSFDTQSVTDMSFMFSGCSSLKSLNISQLYTGQVTNMSGMFRGCSSLTSLDVSYFDTWQVTDMGGMFYDCSSLESLDLSTFNTANVEQISSMFAGCSSLKQLDVSNFNTTKVGSEMNYGEMCLMFAECSSLTSLDLSSFDTSGVVSLGSMFANCSSLVELDLSNFDTGKCSEMCDMFKNCSSLKSLNISQFDTSNVGDISGMFSGCSSLKNLDVSKFDTSNVKWLTSMFENCSNLMSLDLSSFDTSKVKEMDKMVDNCNALIVLKAPANLQKEITLPTPKGYHWEDEKKVARVTAVAGLKTPMVYTRIAGEAKEEATGQESNTDAVVNKTIDITGITISGISKKIASGKTIQLTTAVIPDNASNAAVTWTSSNMKYATVSPSGKVTVKKAGAGKTVTITATAADGSGVKATYKIKIMKNAVKKVKISAAKKTVSAGKSLKLNANVSTTGNSVNKKLQWTSSNTEYATVSKSGKVTAKNAGKGKTVKITAMATDGSGKKATVKIKIK